MEVNTISGDKSTMIESVLLKVKEEPNINNYLPISDTYVESSHVSPMDHSRDGAKPVFKDIAKNYVEIKYDFSKNSPPPLIKIKEEPIESGNTYPAPCHVETGNLHFVEIEDHSGKISRSDDNIFDQNVVIKEEEDITDVFTEDINGLGSSQNLQSSEEDITNQLNNQHVVYIKQEVNINSDSEGNMVDSSTPDDIQEDHSFGQHFLTSLFPPTVHYNPSGQVSDEGVVDTSLQESPSIDVYQTSCAIANSAGETEKSNEDEQEVVSTIFTKNRTVSHQQLNTKIALKCQYCNFQSVYKSVLRHHNINKHHFGMEAIDCPYCKFRSLSLMEVEDHIAKKHNAPKIYHHCPMCVYKTHHAGNARYHFLSNHTNQRDYSCPYCDYMCIQIHRLQKHIFAIHKKKHNLHHLENVCRTKNVL